MLKLNIVHPCGADQHSSQVPAGRNNRKLVHVAIGHIGHKPKSSTSKKLELLTGRLQIRSNHLSTSKVISTVHNMATSTPPAQTFTADINIPPSPVPVHLSRKPHIPPEILSSIFTLCLPDDWEDCGVRARAIPVLLSQVSVYWRSVAVSTPLLWSSMHIRLEKDISDRAMFETWLARTHGTLLSIKVVASSSVDEEQTVTHPMLELILSCCHRWQHFAFDLPISLARSLSAVKDKLPCLESLSAQCRSSWPEQLNPFQNTFQNAPRLTSLDLGPYPTFPDLAVPWTQLTKLKTDMDLDDMMEILHHSPNLVHFCASFYSEDPGATQPLVQLPHVATLVIDTNEDPANLFDCLVVPHLHNLNIFLYGFEPEDDGREWWGWPEPLISLIFRSSCSIQSFTFGTRAIDFVADDLTRCLQAMPTLRDLTLQLRDHWSNVIENILYHLIRRSAKSCIIPKLMYLDLSLLVPRQYKTLIDMIESRWRIVDHGGDGTLDVARLQVVILRGVHFERDLDMLARLRELKDEGMKIELWDFWDNPVTF